MRKFNLVGLISVLLGVAACNGDSSSTINYLGIYPITASYHYLYADQTKDSVKIIATQPFTFKIEDNSRWMSLSSTSDRWEWSAHSADYANVNLYFSTNKSDTVRYGTLHLTDPSHGVYHRLLNTYWLNIVEPQVAFSDKQTYKGAYFLHTMHKDSTNTQFVFYIHDKSATLSTSANWVQPTRFDAKTGENIVPITIEKNTTGQEREAIFELTTSSGVTNKITLHQNN